MKSYVRFQKMPHRKYPASRYRLIQTKIGYLYRADGKILSQPYALSDPACRDGEMLRVPPQPFVDVYYAKMLPCIRNDAEQEAAAVYFDPYAGQFVVAGSKQLYLDAKDTFGIAGTPLFLEKESAFSFDPMTYGAYFDPDTAESMTYDDYFVPDVTGVTVADCMTAPAWDDRAAPWQCAVEFFNRYCDRLTAEAAAASPDTLTTLLASIVRQGNHFLLSRLLILMPQLTSRFRPTLQEEEKFTALTLPGWDDRIQNLFHYLLLCGNPDCLTVLFRFYERPLELSEFLRHPMYYTVGHYHIRQGNAAALACLLSHNFYPDAVDGANGRMPLISCACRYRAPAIAASLLAAGCDPEKRDGRGVTAFDYAAAQNDCTMLSLLFESVPRDTAREYAASIAEGLPLSDDNQALLGILKKYL